MEFLGLTLWQWVLPVLIGVTAGFCTNAIAIWMLFHPYRDVYLGRVRLLPMGAIPKEIDRIAKRIGETVGRELLSPEDIARRLGSDAFRERFDDVLRGALRSLLDRELGSLQEMMNPAQATELAAVIDSLSDRLREGLEAYLASADWERRVHSFSRSLRHELRDESLAVVITPSLHADLLRGITELWEGVRESPAFRRVIADALERGIGNILVSAKPLRHYVPTGAVNLGEAFVAQYLPLLLERLGEVLEDPVTRGKLQATLRRFVDGFLEEQKTWKRIVGRLVMTERTLSQTLDALEQGGVDEISSLLREPDIQERVAQAVNDGVEELLDRPVSDLLGEVTPERAGRLRNMMADRIIYLFRHPTTEEVVVRRVDAVLTAAQGKTVGDLLQMLGSERARDISERLGDWMLKATRGPRAQTLLERTLDRQTSWMMSVRIGRAGQYLPPNAVVRAEQLLFNPLWDFIQQRVPAAVSDLPVARMVEDKLKGYPVQKVEELIWRVSRNELVLIIYLGGFLGALIGGMMLFTTSWPAGLLATGVFLLLSFIFLAVKA